MEKDDTQYRLITSDYVSVGDFEGHPMLKVEPEGLRLLAAEAFSSEPQTRHLWMKTAIPL